MDQLDIVKELQTFGKTIIADCVAGLVQDEFYDELEHYTKYEVTENGEIKIGDQTFSGDLKVNGIVIPDCIDLYRTYDECRWAHEYNKQIAAQVGIKPVDELGIFKKRAGLLFEKDVRVELSFLDLYNVYQNDKLIAEDIYCTEIQEKVLLAIL